MDLNDRTRMYWQLWLYYVELGHKPTFFNELFDKFRENPIDFSNAKTDFLRFAQFCSEIAQKTSRNSSLSMGSSTKSAKTSLTSITTFL